MLPDLMLGPRHDYSVSYHQECIHSALVRHSVNFAAMYENGQSPPLLLNYLITPSQLPSRYCNRPIKSEIRPVAVPAKLAPNPIIMTHLPTFARFPVAPL